MKRDGRLVLSVGMISAASPGRMPVPVFLQGYCPVIKAYLEGVQLAEVDMGEGHPESVILEKLGRLVGW